MKQEIKALFIFFVIMSFIPTRLSHQTEESKSLFTKYLEMFKEDPIQFILDGITGISKAIKFTAKVIGAILLALTGTITIIVQNIVAIFQAATLLINNLDSEKIVEASFEYLKLVNEIVHTAMNSEEAKIVYELVKQAINAYLKSK